MQEHAERVTMAICGAVVTADITGVIDYIDAHAGFFGIAIAFLSYITSTILKLRNKADA